MENKLQKLYDIRSTAEQGVLGAKFFLLDGLFVLGATFLFGIEAAVISVFLTKGIVAGLQKLTIERTSRKISQELISKQ